MPLPYVYISFINLDQVDKKFLLLNLEFSYFLILHYIICLKKWTDLENVKIRGARFICFPGSCMISP